MFPSVVRATATILAAASLHIQAEAATVQACGMGSTKSDQTLRVNGYGNVLYAEPSSKSEKLVNQKATKILNRTIYIGIDNTTTVIEECKQQGWSRVRVIEPDWLRDSHIGWVPSSVLRVPKMDSGGKNVFTEADFVWDKKTQPHKKTIVAGVNKVFRVNPGCKNIDPSSAYISASKGNSSDPVFFVTCGSGAGAFNVFFSKSEVEKGIALGAVNTH